MKFGSPLSLTAAPYQLGQYDTLLNAVALPTIPINSSVSFNFSGVNAYTAFLVSITNYNNAVAVAIANNAIPSASIKVSTGIICRNPTTSTVILPAVTNVGDPMVVTIYSGSNAGNNAGNITVLGLTNTQAPPYRSDGRAHPLGVFAANGSAVNTQTTLIPAPANPNLRVMIKNVMSQINPGASGGAGTINVQISGASVNIITYPNVPLNANGYAITESWPEGLLLDPGSAFIVSSGGTSLTIGAAVQYDLVPI